MYGIESPLNRTDAIGVGARLDLRFPEAVTANRLLSASYSGITIPYQSPVRTKHINLGSPTDAKMLPKLRANLHVVMRRQEAGRALSIMLSDFRTLTGRPTTVGRPMSNMRQSEFGGSYLHYEAYDALQLVGDEATGALELKGKYVGEDAWNVLVNNNRNTREVRSNPGDPFAFAAACIVAMSKTSVEPVVSVQ